MNGEENEQAAQNGEQPFRRTIDSGGVGPGQARHAVFGLCSVGLRHHERQVGAAAMPSSGGAARGGFPATGMPQKI